MFRIKGETFFFRLRKEGDLFFAEAVMLGVKESCEKFMLEVSIFDPESKISSSATLVPRPAAATNDGEGCLTVHQKTLATIWKHNVEMKSYEFQVSIKVDGPDQEVSCFFLIIDIVTMFFCQLVNKKRKVVIPKVVRLTVR